MQKGLSLFWRGAAAHCLRALAVLQAACCNHWRCISSIPDLSVSLRATPVGSATLKLLTLATRTQEASDEKNMQKTWKNWCVLEGTFQNANCVHKNWRCEVFSSSTPTDSWQIVGKLAPSWLEDDVFEFQNEPEMIASLRGNFRTNSTPGRLTVNTGPCCPCLFGAWSNEVIYSIDQYRKSKPNNQPHYLALKYLRDQPPGS